MRFGAFACCLALTACSASVGQDWRTKWIDKAETQIRGEVGDSAAKFAGVQVTGDQRTGQICGTVESANARPARFILYIDGSAGPFIEGGRGKTFMAPDQFDFQWGADCLNQGYKS